MRVTRSQPSRGSLLLLSALPDDAWITILESVGDGGVQAEATSTLFMENLRSFRTTLKLPKMYACRFNGVIRDQEDGVRRYDKHLYADLLIKIVERYPNLQVLDTTAIWGGRMSYDDEEPLTELMMSLYLDGLAPMLERLITQPSAAFVVRYMIECVHDVKVEPPLSHDVMAFLAAGNKYGYGCDTKVKFVVESESLTNKAHYYNPVRATTPGGSEFEIYWKVRGGGLDDVDMSDDFAETYPESDALGPDGDDLDWDHPEFRKFCDEREAEIKAGWALDLKENPFALLLGADNGCDLDCCGIKLVKRGEDFRVCSCEHKRPVFAPEPKENRRRTRSEREEPDEQCCVCGKEL